MPRLPTRRDFLSLPLALPALRAAQPARPPNIVILLADDLGWADVGYHHSEIHTPNIDRLASQGTRFERYYAFPLCSPTRSALMTGRSPIRLGVVYATIEPFDDHGVPVEEHFMPQTLKAAGYETAMTGKWHLGHTRRAFFPNARGFDHSYGFLNGRIDYYTHDREGGLDWHRDGKTDFEKGYSTELIGREAMRLIRERDRAKPLFLYVPFNAPHAPLHKPPRYMDNYAHIKDEDRRQFCATVQYMDDVIGRILATLDDEHMTNDTLVMFFSDNGGPTGLGAKNTPLRGGKRSTYEGGIRVPMILRWPSRLKAGAVSNRVMTVMDVFPTFAGIAGTTPRNKLPLDGKNLWPALRSGRVEPREDLFFGTGSGSAFIYGVLHQEWKLVRTISRKDDKATNELFRIEEDPIEQHDVAAQHPDLVKDLSARIDRWRALYPSDGIIDPKKDATPEHPAPKQWAEAAR
jgi:arylsulfatase A-like enzyme